MSIFVSLYLICYNTQGWFLRSSWTSLYNVLFKVITKALVNSICAYLESCITISLSGHVPFIWRLWCKKLSIRTRKKVNWVISSLKLILKSLITNSNYDFLKLSCIILSFLEKSSNWFWIVLFLLSNYILDNFYPRKGA